MAKYFRINNATFAGDFKAALEVYYGDGVSVTSASGTTIIFQCPAVCDKELKFVKTDGGFNAFVEANQFAFAYSGTADGYNLILSGSFLLLDADSQSDYRCSALVAKLTNGRYMAMGGQYSSGNDTYRKNNKCLFTDTMTICPIRMIAPQAEGFRTNNKLCLWPAYVANDQEIELNDDGTFARVPGLYLTSKIGLCVVGSNYYLSNAPLRGTAAEGAYCYTQKYVELEME